jgi:DNA-binding IclR family transcriptional regulator
MQILECFMDAHTEWTLKALVDRLDLPTTTVFRQISTLVDRQYLEQDPVRKSYRVGPRLYLLSSAILGHSDMRSLARSEMERLSEVVKETVNLSVLLDYDIFYLDKVETHRSVVCNTRVGSRAPAYATSGGKAMMAFQSEDFVEDYCQWMVRQPPLTDFTITSPDQLRQELVDTRLRGWAMDNEEIEQGLICFGAPIFDMTNRVRAAVSIAGPGYRRKEDESQIIEEVKKSAERISALMGYRT